MLWIPVLVFPLGVALAKLGSATTMVSVLTLALQATGAVAFLLAMALASMLYLHRSRS